MALLPLNFFPNHWFNHNKDYFSNTFFYPEGNAKLKLNWGNTTATAEYFNFISSKSTLRSLITLSNYKYQFIINANTDFKARLKNVSNLFDLSVSTEYDYFYNKRVNSKTGLFSEIINITPVKRELEIEDQLTSSGGEIEPLRNFSLYQQLNLNLGNSLEFGLGARGELVRNNNDGSSRFYLQPRSNLLIKLSKTLNAELAYSRVIQNLHSVSANTGTFFIDVWVPATKRLPPQNGDLYNLALFYKNKKFNFGAEVYYKKLSQLAELNANSSFFVSSVDNWQDDIIGHGKGKVKGFEIYTDFKYKNLNYSINYNYAHSQRKFAEIQDNQWFDFRYDRRHVFNAGLNGQINDKWSFNSSFVFTTGRPLTLPSVVHQDYYGRLDVFYTDINSGRFPLYHRLDLGFSRTNTTKKGNEMIWTLSLYNAYANPNVFGVEIRNKKKFDNGVDLNIKEISFFRFIPGISLTYNFK